MMFDGAEVILHETLDEAIAAFFRCTVEDVQTSEWEGLIRGYHEDGEPYALTFDEWRSGYLKGGLFAFVRGKKTIHFWAAKETDPDDIIVALAHELGHVARPHHRDARQEEMKAGRYAMVTMLAMTIYRDLIEPGNYKSIIKHVDKDRFDNTSASKEI